MKRLDIEPDEKTILDSLKKNLTGRNDDIVDFIKLLADTEGPFTYMIDAHWGDGKTFFVKSVEYVLKTRNPNVPKKKEEEEKEEETSAEFENILTKLSQTNDSFLPFYFNAWENDFADDPICALFANMAAEFERYEKLKEVNIKTTILNIVGMALTAGLSSIPGIGGQLAPLADTFVSAPSKTAEAIEGTNLVESFTMRQKIREKIGLLANEITKEVANHLIIFIDELDRCRPDFAVRLLEQTKNLFDSDKIILVFSTDSCQLAKAVSGVYGHGFDSTRFLDRFFDQRVTMTPVNAFDFTHPENPLVESNLFDVITDKLLKTHTLSIRDMNRLNVYFDDARKYAESAPWMSWLEANVALPILIYAHWANPEKFYEITSGENPDTLYEYGKSIGLLTQETEGLIASLIENQSRVIPYSDIAQKLRDACRDLFTNSGGKSSSHVRRPIMSPNERKIFTALNFGPWLEEQKQIEASKKQA